SNGNGSNMPVIAISGQPGTMLYIRVWGYQNMSGTFGICAMNYTSTNLTDTDTGAFYTIPDETGNQSAERDLLSTTDLALAIPFPNPTSGILTIPVTSTETSDVRISVMDEMGRLVLSSPLTEADVNHQLQINIASLTNGFYIVKVNTVSGSVSHKIQLLR
ncbi:MAG: T9SS type A sorting domain-containing protein, partial [Bacteroidota bacterium]